MLKQKQSKKNIEKKTFWNFFRKNKVKKIKKDSSVALGALGYRRVKKEI